MRKKLLCESCLVYMLPVLCMWSHIIIWYTLKSISMCSTHSSIHQSICSFIHSFIFVYFQFHSFPNSEWVWWLQEGLYPSLYNWCQPPDIERTLPFINKFFLVSFQSEFDDYEKGCILHFTGVNDQTSREDLKELFGDHGTIQWVDFERGQTEVILIKNMGLFSLKNDKCYFWFFLLIQFLINYIFILFFATVIQKVL